jgi:uncharacterized protein (DUF2225 family)
MDCPICGNDIDNDSNKITSESGAFKTAYECPHCGGAFKKETLLRNGLGFAAKALVLVALGDLNGGDWGASA